MSLLDDRCAVITGGARGLGLEIARAFLTQGASVVIADLDEDVAAEAADRLVTENVGTAIGVGCNVTEERDIVHVVEQCTTRLGGLDIWVNNAGITRDMTMRKMTLADFRVVIDVHLQGTWLGMKHAAAYMRENGGGAIVNMSSISGKVGNPGQTNYSAAKAGIVGMTKAAAKELGHLGIRVNAIQPGLIKTAMTDAMKPDVVAQRITNIPLGRIGQPVDVANAALYLASDLSSFVTGIVLEVSGGRHI